MYSPCTFAAGTAALMLFTSCLQSSGAGKDAPPGNNQQNTTQTVIQWTVKTDNSYITNKSPEEVYLFMSVKTGQPKSIKKRVPLNISLVLDRSGSMRGDKIVNLRKAAKFVVDQLSVDDYLSIVNYDDGIEVTSPSQLVKNKESLKMKIDHLFDRGSTNLSGGLLEGYTQVKSTMKEGYVNRVLILTDGLANQGIVEPARLKELVYAKYSQQGIALSTFGLGADYDENLLTSLAETGHANYYFIDSADKIPALFASELKGLLSVMAQNAVAEITLPEGFICEKVYGYPYDVKDRKVVIRFNDIYSNDEKTFLMKLKPGQNLAQDPSFNCSLLYTDAEDYKVVHVDKKITLTRTDDAGLMKKNEDKQVHEALTLFEATSDFENILTKVDANDYDGAKQVGRQKIMELKSKQLQYNSAKIQKQVEDMEIYVNRIDTVQQMKSEEKKMFQKSNKAINYKSVKGKR